MGAYIRYQKNKDNTGFGAELSGAFLNQDITITRHHLKNTEAGHGDSSIIGINISWHQTDYTNDAAQAGLNYSYHW